MAALVTLLAIVVALLLVLVAGLLRSHAEILRALHDLGVGLGSPPSPERSLPSRPRPDDRQAVDLIGTTPQGGVASIAVLGTRRSTLLAFLTTGCSTCASFWTAFAQRGKARVPGGARLVVVTKGEEAESPARLRRFSTRPSVPIVMSSDAWEAYDVPVAPYFVYVDGASGRIVGEGAASTWPHLVDMMDQALTDAGLDPSRTRESPTRRAESGQVRAAHVDDVLLAAGIEPGDRRLYPSSGSDLLTKEQ